MAENLREAALEYHYFPKPGKIEVVPTKPLATQRDLALAYSPGVAAACDAIVADPNEAARVTSRGNLVAVITNGTAVLGLGAIGPLAAKPVMEGKGVLFKKFAGIDVFDIEIDERDPDKLVDIIAALEPSFGGINLEDIKAPECFEVERKLRERLKIPVFHDDQHGTAIIAAAAILNGLKLLGKNMATVTLATSGAGAAAIACLDLLVSLGIKRDNITVCDSKGVVYRGRDPDMTAQKAAYARDTDARTLADAMVGADIFLGLSVPGMVTETMLKTMAPKPLVLALANPVPEVMPEVVKAARPDAIVATGRSDYPNQVNNALCFPYIFRGALDVGATTINESMKLACVHAIAALAQAESSDVVSAAYGGAVHQFGVDYIIPKPFDPRLIEVIAPAVAKAAMDSGIAARAIADLDAYRQQLGHFVFRTGFLMKPVMERARAQRKRVVFAEGEDEKVLRSVQVIVDEQLAYPVLVGRPDVITMRMARLGLRLRAGEHFEICNPQSDPRYREYWTAYHAQMERRGVTPDLARTLVRTDSTVISAIMLRRGEVDAMICGAEGRYHHHLKHVLDIVGTREGVHQVAAMNVVILPKGCYFFCDTQVNVEPDAQQIAEITLLAAQAVKRFGITPKAALLSHSNFGSSQEAAALKMREALRLVQVRDPGLEVEGEMTPDLALEEDIRQHIFPSSRLMGAANLLIHPSLDAANIAFQLTRRLADGVAIGPLLLGAAMPVHIVTPAASVRGIVNVTAMAAVEAAVEK
jgi:malate dehydrogenase (oxaloacetate-decarboxylating)(NADP+)